MGKQSARLYYQGKDHKDIFYQGNFHDKMYKGSQLLWEKLYPEAYFVTTRLLQNKYRYVTEIISKDGVDEIAQVPWDRNIENPKSYQVVDFCSKAILCRFPHSYGYCFTADGRNFKQIPQLEYPTYAIGDGFCKISGNKITIAQIKSDLSYDVSEFESDLLSVSDYITYQGNYLFGLASDKAEGSASNRTRTREWMTIDAHGNFAKHVNTYNVNNEDEAIKYGNDTKLNHSDFGFSVVLGDYAYWCVTGPFFTNVSDGPIYLSRSAKIIRRNLSTFTDTVLIDTEDINDSWRFHNLLYLSTTKAVYLGIHHNGDNTYAIVARVGDEGASIKRVKDMRIRVLGEDRYVEFVSVFLASEPTSVNKIILDISNTLHLYTTGNLPTMRKGVYEPDAVEGMAFYFSYGYTNANPWYVMGYMYIDNFDFAESENNYIYITKEYVDGELVIDR